MATTKNKKAKKSENGSKSKRMGKKTSDKYDIAKAMVKSEKLYDELKTKSTQAFNGIVSCDDKVVEVENMDTTTEYIVTARSGPGATLAGKAINGPRLHIRLNSSGAGMYSSTRHHNGRE